MTEADAHALIYAAYDAFNRRDIAAALACMTGDVTWPKASEGGIAHGKDEIRDYWTRQWSEFQPHVTPLKITFGLACPGAREFADVRVHQRVLSLTGELLFDGEVTHLFSLRDGRIAAMHLGSGDRTAAAAFTHRARSLRLAKQSGDTRLL